MALAQSNSIRGEVMVRHLSKTYTLNGTPAIGPEGSQPHHPFGRKPGDRRRKRLGQDDTSADLAGLEDADSGDVLIDGRRIRGRGHERAVIFQEPRLLPG